MATKRIYKMREKLFLWSGENAAWHFLPITKSVGAEIKKQFGTASKGFGSLPVEVTVGKTVWQTSIFPDKTSGSYILPVKAKVRNVEDLMAGDAVSFAIRII